MLISFGVDVQGGVASINDLLVLPVSLPNLDRENRHDTSGWSAWLAPDYSEMSVTSLHHTLSTQGRR